MYSIIDIETTGNGVEGNRITEISIFKYDGHTIVDEFTSLVNPEMPIPYFITGLTGIDDDMVRNAPKLAELIPKIVEITNDTIFVAHSVNFDYNVIKNEFKNLGHEFVKKKLCTVRLSRKLFPGYTSYSLGKLCTALNIPLKDRHRARGDAHATVLLFEKLLRAEGATAVFKTFLNSKSQEATLPPLLSRNVYDDLPTKPGIYFFKDSKGKIIYIGKAINIKKRISSHFYDKSEKEIKLCREIAHIDFELSGSEILALLMESAAIKHYFPKYNSAQKRKSQQYGIFTYEDQNGIKHLAPNKLKAMPNALATFYSISECRNYLENVCRDFNLCPKYCHLQEGVSTCSHYSIVNCEGICRGKENALDYNLKVENAIAFMQTKKENFFIKEKGRTLDEDAIILIKDGIYNGYAFIEKQSAITTINDLEHHIKLQSDTIEVQQIIYSYLNKNSNNVYSYQDGVIVS
ncbi:GIY-YIG nuclease family protein [Aurantibacter crassamenti]|uniref:exonuclease domain-containing protein n=1 Tax=Aurantibacter crassamenti TaxID=1837375 RepID=UPI0019394AE7|nr:exonuclease domain-containing protein [Aurantibacter crassamenti]MBM1106183.1 GIY-YIG nuclease family protein [Aurantibacter crassamenti]